MIFEFLVSFGLISSSCGDSLAFDASLVRAYQSYDRNFSPVEIELKLQTVRSALDRAQTVKDVSLVLEGLPPMVIAILGFELIRAVETEWTGLYPEEASTFLSFVQRLRGYLLVSMSFGLI